METGNISSLERHSRGATTKRLKTVRVIQLLALLAAWLPALAQAQFRHTTNNGTITITDYTGLDREVAIPDTINGLPVTRIGFNAFFSRTNLTSVTIPIGVTRIESGAFNACSSLTNVTVPSTVTNIGNLENPDLNSITFSGCKSLTAINVDAANATYSSVNGVLFNKSQSLMIQCPGGKAGVYTMPGGVSNIVDYAFFGCTSLTGVIIPNSVTTIGNYAFYYCTSLAAFTIPSNVLSVGFRAFYQCTNLTNVTIGSGVTVVSGGVFENCTGLTSVQIPDGVTLIGAQAFYRCSQLTTIIIPNNVTNIGSYAFAGCSDLTTITIPRKVTNIGDSAFAGCDSLTSFIVDSDNSTFSSADGVWFDKSQTVLIRFPAAKAGSYTIPTGVTTVLSEAFHHCNRLTSIRIPAGVTTIGDLAFSGCTNMVSVILPSSLTNIAEYTFYGCSSLTNVTIPENVTSIGDTAFSGCSGLKSIKIPNSVTSVGNSAFSGCTGIVSITIGTSVRSIGNFAFAFCVGLSTIEIPSSVSAMRESAFYRCTNIVGIYFHGIPPALGSPVFTSDNAATIYYLPGTTGWGPTFGGRPTALWLPQVSTGDASFGVRTNQFGFNIHWASGRTVVVEACEDLANPIWIPVSTNTLIEGSSYFSDPQWANTPARFYRLREP